MLQSLVGLGGASPESRQRDQRAAFLGLVGLIGAIATAICLILSQVGNVAGAIGLGGLILFASAAAGAALGFLFSVPRVLATGDDQPAANESKRTISQNRLLSTNTNMERISEWLTTMIVGVGLSQITSVGSYIQVFTNFLEVRSGDTLAAAGPFILIVGLVSGFVFLYLYTRLYLSSLFLHVEQLMNRVGLQELPKAIDQIRVIAQELAERDNSSMMRYIASVDQISFDHTMYVLNALLYEDRGYQKVLEIGDELEDTAAAEMARYWFLMAAAHGQRHKELASLGTDEEERVEARQAVLKASRKAVLLDNTYKRRLKELSNAKSSDDDLRDFAKDPEFLRIVGS
jgi:hypothetical protein